MYIKEFKEDKWIFMNEDIDFDKLYGEEYEKRIDNNYYNPVVLDKRKEFINRFVNINKTYDFGCGRNPVAMDEKLYNYDPYVEKFKNFDYTKFMEAETILLFDVLEHFFDLKTVLTLIPQKYMIGTIPIVPNNDLKNIEQLKDWKHYKPGEHYFLMTEIGFKEILKLTGWDIICFEYNECPPRQDIASFYCIRK